MSLNCTVSRRKSLEGYQERSLFDILDNWVSSRNFQLVKICCYTNFYCFVNSSIVVGHSFRGKSFRRRETASARGPLL